MLYKREFELLLHLQALKSGKFTVALIVNL